MKLVWRYSLTLLSVLATVILVMLAIQLWEIDRSTKAMKALAESSLKVQLDEQLKTRGRSMAEVLAENVVSPYLTYDMVAIYELLLPVRRSEAVRAVYFFDQQGRIIHDASKEINLYGELIVRQAPDIQIDLNHAQLLTRPDSFAAIVPVVAGSDQLGSIYVELSRNGVTQPIALMQRRYDEIAAEQREANIAATALSALILAVIGLVLTFIAARRLVSPILDLVEHTRSVAEGDYDVKIDIDRRDEIGDLASAFADMSAQIDAKSEHIEYLAFHDRLTGLPNRAAFADAMQAHFDAQQLAESPPPGAVLFVDLDDFKRVNDTLSHEAGDQLLCELGERMKRVVADLGFSQLPFGRRSIAPVARWGGDEFTIYLDGVESEAEAAKFVETILQRVAEPFMIAGLEISVRASVGVAFYPRDDRNIEMLLNYADVAMYHSREHGSSAAHVYSAVMSEDSSHLALESDLRGAIENRELSVHYQAVLDPISETLQGLEAELCWQHPREGLLDAKSFMAIAESSGLAGAMDAWLVETALREFGAWQKTGSGEPELTINLSGGQLEAQSIVDILAAGIEGAGIDSGRIIVEFTETQLFHNVLRAAQLLNDVRTLGVQTWMDAFGSGYSSINRLRRMPLDGLKIDATLIASLDEDRDDQNLVAAVISLAHSLGLRAGAEGVNNREQLDFLRRGGCDTVQGAYFGRAMKSARAAQYLRQSERQPASPIATG